jgi:hypothetical protein
MPDVETWTFNAVPSSSGRVTRLGINFGAPGDRRDEEGTLWLEFPSVGGPSPDVPLTISGAALEYERQHASLIPGDHRPWVFASGVRDARHVRIRLAGADAAAAAAGIYTVRLYWRTLAADAAPRGVSLQGVRVDGMPLATTSGLVHEYRGVHVDQFLEIDLDMPGTAQAADPARGPLLCGIEMVLDPR